MKAVNPKTGELIRKLSQHRGLRPGQLAGKLKLKGPQVSQIFSGQKKVDGSLAVELAEILKIPASDLIEFAENERAGVAVSVDEGFEDFFPRERVSSRITNHTAQSLHDEFQRNSEKFCLDGDHGSFFCVGAIDDDGRFIMPKIEGPTVVLTLSDAVWVDPDKDNFEIDDSEIVLKKGDELCLYVSEAIHLPQDRTGRLEVHSSLSNRGLVCGQTMPVTLAATGEAIHLDLYVRNDLDREIKLLKSMPIFRFIPG